MYRTRCADCNHLEVCKYKDEYQKFSLQSDVVNDDFGSKLFELMPICYLFNISDEAKMMNEMFEDYELHPENYNSNMMYDEL